MRLDFDDPLTQKPPSVHHYSRRITLQSDSASSVAAGTYIAVTAHPCVQQQQVKLGGARQQSRVLQRYRWERMWTNHVV
jgi:hypothetical protein